MLRQGAHDKDFVRFGQRCLRRLGGIHVCFKNSEPEVSAYTQWRQRMDSNTSLRRCHSTQETDKEYVDCGRKLAAEANGFRVLC
jgi:hypothetical protein